METFVGQRLATLLAVRPVPRTLAPFAVLQWLTASLASLYLTGFVVAGVVRLFEPYPLSDIEGLSGHIIRRILQGQSVYAEPTLEYVPVMYAPFYYYASAVVATLTGPTYLPLRLVALLASLGSAWVIYRIVQRETSSRFIGLVSGALFICSTRLGYNFDAARVDALCVFLLLCALSAVRAADLDPWAGWQTCAAGGIAAGLAVLTKQTTVVIALALAVYAFSQSRSRLVAYVLAVVTCVTLGLAAIYVQAGDWARFYMYDLPRLHDFNDQHVANFWVAEIVPRFTLPLVIAPLFFIGRWRRGDRRGVAFYALASVSLLGTSWAAWANRGADANTLQPAFALLAVLFGLGLHQGLGMLGGHSREIAALRCYLLGLCVAQFLIVGYDPCGTVPPRSESWASDRLVATIAALPGRVFAPEYGAWTLPAGKGEQVWPGAVIDLIGGMGGSGSPAPGKAWTNEVQQALQARAYDYVLVDPESRGFILTMLLDQSGYVDVGPLFKEGDEFYVWTSGSTPGAHLYMPAERRPAPD